MIGLFWLAFTVNNVSRQGQSLLNYSDHRKDKTYTLQSKYFQEHFRIELRSTRKVNPSACLPSSHSCVWLHTLKIFCKGTRQLSFLPWQVRAGSQRFLSEGLGFPKHCRFIFGLSFLTQAGNHKIYNYNQKRLQAFLSNVS